MRLGTLTLEQCELVRQWRNDPLVLPMLRTREPLTEAQQAAFYRDVVCNPESNHRYYALIQTMIGIAGVHEPPGWREAHPGALSAPHDVFVGMGGLTYLDRVPGEGEISLILGPEFRRSGLGAQAVQALRTEATRLGLTWVVGECYCYNDGTTPEAFWLKQVVRCDGHVRYEQERMFFRMRPLQPVRPISDSLIRDSSVDLRGFAKAYSRTEDEA